MAQKDDMQDEAEEEGKRCKACACSCKSKKSGDWRAWFGKKTQSGACFGLAKTTKNNGPRGNIDKTWLASVGHEQGPRPRRTAAAAAGHNRHTPPPSGQVSKYTLLGAIAGHSCSDQQRDGDFVLRRRGVCLLPCLLLGVWSGDTLEGRREILRLPQLEPRGAGLWPGVLEAGCHL